MNMSPGDARVAAADEFEVSATHRELEWYLFGKHGGIFELCIIVI